MAKYERKDYRFLYNRIGVPIHQAMYAYIYKFIYFMGALCAVKMYRLSTLHAIHLRMQHMNVLFKEVDD